jgi:hypothetical protein
VSEEPVKSGRYTFDLSDGFGREDIFAVFAAIWNFIKLIFKIIFYPYVWMIRMFGRSIRFVRTKEAAEKLLNEDERYFMESVPTFFVLMGFFLGLLLGVIVAFGASDAITEFFESLSLDTLISGIAWWLLVIIEIILTIIGLGYHDIDFLVWKKGDERSLGLIDWIRGFFELMYNIVQSDPVLLFLGIGLIGISLAVIWIVVSETGIVSGVLSVVRTILHFLVTAPYKAFDMANQIFLATNHKLSSFVIGTERLENRTVSFHRKILLYALALGLWTFLGGLFVLAAEVAPTDPAAQQIAFFLIILFVFGVGVGIIELFVIVRFLDTVSRKKYAVRSTEAKE